MPGVSHRFCAMHLWRNFTKQWKDKEMKNVVWDCARARTVEQFNAKMNRLRAKNAQAWAYLNKWPKESWTKAYFKEGVKSDNICNNACESFNAKILKYRGKPILTLLEEVRCYIMRTVATNKIKFKGQQGLLPPMQRSRLETEKKDGSKGWTPVFTGDVVDERYEVQGWEGKVDVSLTRHTCTCRFWQLTGMPCKHACAAIAWKHDHAEDYCHAWLTMGAYRSTYEHCVRPTASQQYWEQTDYVRPIPPRVNKRKPGRPKKNRRRDGNEEPVAGSRNRRRAGNEPPVPATRIRRSYPPITCTRCGLTGHNTRSCHNIGAPIRPTNWVPPPPEVIEDEVDVSQNAPNGTPQQPQVKW